MAHWQLSSKQLQPTATIPPAILSGFCVYTTFRISLQPIWIQAHLNRLAENARFLGLDWPFSHLELLQQIHSIRTSDEPIIRITAYANVASFHELFQKNALACHLLISARPAPNPPHPLRLKTVSFKRPFPTIKLGAIASEIYLKRQAMAKSYADVLLVNQAGHITEASTANFFAIDAQNQLHTPPDDCLPGITRLQIIEIAKQLDLPVHTRPIPQHEIPHFTGAFLTNAAQGIIPIEQIDHTRLSWPAQNNSLLEPLQTKLAALHT